MEQYMRRHNADKPADALDSIARYVEHNAYRQLPNQVIRQAKKLLLEGISWMVMGARKEEAQGLLRFTYKEGTQDEERCNVIGAKQKADFLDAVLSNTALAQVHDCNDTRRLARRDGGSNHPGRCVIPVALTLGQRYKLSGEALLELIVTGYEIASRVKTPYTDMEYSYTAAAMTAKVARLSRDSIRRALALAHFSFPMTTEFPDELDFNHLKYGFINKSAVSSVSYADETFILPFEQCNIELGAEFPSMDDSEPDAYAMMYVSIKPYPCCRALHGAVDLALDLCASQEFAASEIAAVEIRVGNTKEVLFQPVAPGTYYKRGQFSFPYVTACAFLDQEVSENSFTEQRIAKQDVQQFQKKIHCISDEKLQFNPSGGLASLTRPTLLTVTMVDGKQYFQKTLSPKGSSLNPLSEKELLAKFNAWMGPSFSAPKKAQIVSMVNNVETVSDVSQLMALLET